MMVLKITTVSGTHFLGSGTQEVDQPLAVIEAEKPVSRLKAVYAKHGRRL